MSRAGDRWVGALGIVLFALVLGGLWLWRMGGADTPDGSPVVWSRLKIDGDRLRVSYEGTTCMKPGEAVVEEDDDRVVVTVYAEEPDGLCGGMARVFDLVAELDAPLADRPVYDGECLERSRDAEDESCRRAPGTE